MTIVGEKRRRRVGVRGWPLLTYFSLLVSLFVVAAVVAVVYVEIQTDKDARAAAHKDASFAAKTAAKQLGEFVALQKAAVQSLASNPQITQSLSAPTGCSLTYSGIGGPDGSHIDIIRADGTVACSSRARSGNKPVRGYSGTSLLRRALARPVFIAPTVDAATGTPVAINATPIPGHAGIVAGFADLRSVALKLATLYGGGHRVEFLVTSSDGRTVIARSIDPRRWIGASLVDTPFARYPRTSDRPDLDGTPRLYAEARVAGVGWRFYVGEEKAAALAAGTHLESRELTIIAVGLAAILFAAWLVYRNVVAPLARLNRGVRSSGLRAGSVLPAVAGPAEVTALGDEIARLIASGKRELLERERADARASAVIESALDAVITIDHSGAILEFNPAAESKFGHARADVLGKEMADLLIPAPLRDAHRSGLKRLVETGEGATVGARLEVTALRGDGSEFPVELAITRVPLDGPPVFTAYVRDISDRLRSQEALRVSEEQYRLLFEDNPNPMWVYDTETLRFLAVNGATIRSYGYSRDEFLAMTVGDILPAEDAPKAKAIVKPVRERKTNGVSETGVWRNRRKDGSIIQAEITSHSHEFQGRAARVVHAIDVTERLLAEQTLRESETRYRELFENASDLIATVDLDSRLTSVNAAFVRALGYSREELIGRPLNDFVPAEWHARLGTARAVKFDEGLVATVYEHELLAKDGHRIWVEVASRVIEESGRPVGVEAICRDVSDRRQSELDLRAAEVRYRTLVERLPLVTYTEPLNASSAAYISPQIARLVGYSAEEWEGSSDFFSRVLHPDDRERVLAEFDAMHRSGEPLDIEYRLIAQDGQVVWIHDGAVVVHDDNGKNLYAQGYMLDITERRRSEEALKESQELYRLVVESTADMISLSDLEGRIVYASPSHTDLLGRSQDDLIGTRLLDLAHVDDCEAITSAGRDTATAEALGAPIRLRHKDGRYINVETTRTPILDEKGRPRLVLTSARDVTHRERADELEEQLRQAQRLESVGRLAGGIAHDFNNLLTVISGYTEALLEKRQAAAMPELDEIAAAAKRAAVLTRQLLAFSRRQVLQPRVTDLNEVVQGLMPMLTMLIGENIDLAAPLDPELAAVLADPSQIEQVLVNLVVNARDAMPQGGRLTIETGNVYLDRDYVNDHPDAQIGRHAMLAVSDTGIGMNQETIGQMFEPFFTTKPVGAGTGLGLSTVYGIVKQSGGNIWVYSEPGRGSSFKVYLPASETLSVSNTQKRIDDVAPTGTETILIVEDEQALRVLTARMLTHSGYSVLAAESPEAALSIIEDGERQIDLLLTDLVMPEMDGHELADQITQKRPDVRVVFMSGYADEAITRSGIELAPFLEKPFSAADLARIVRETLDAPISRAKPTAAQQR
jgi:two-component system cell cycle sensor histidine kinase/response regulator CckA